MDIFAVLFPKRCVGCHRVGAYICMGCINKLTTISVAEMCCPICNRPAIDGAVHPRCRKLYSLDGLTCFFRYRGLARLFVHEMKYRLVADVAQSFVSVVPDEMLAAIRVAADCMPLVIVPIPLAPRRQKHRGFNQAELIANALGVRLGIPINTTMLLRTKETTPQAMIEKRVLRLQNMKNAFSVAKETDASFGVLLCDDVYTTGATLKNAAGALKRAGIKYVWGIAMAR